MAKGSSKRANVLVSANDPEVIVKLKITLRQGKIRLARIRTFGHLENALLYSKGIPALWPYHIRVRMDLLFTPIEDSPHNTSSFSSPLWQLYGRLEMPSG